MVGQHRLVEGIRVLDRCANRIVDRIVLTAFDVYVKAGLIDDFYVETTECENLLFGIDNQLIWRPDSGFSIVVSDNEDFRREFTEMKDD